MSNLPEAIDRLYEAFATVPKPHHIDGCPHCVDPEEMGVLLGKSLRDLSPQQLASYASSAFLTVGDAADYLYFLPRIMEITATEPSWWPDPEVTGRAILASKPDVWAPAQRAALNDYLEAVVGAAIETANYDWLDGWICAIGRMGLDVRPFLGRVAGSPAAVLAYFRQNAESLPRQRLANAFWEHPCPAHDAVVEWFHSDEIAHIIFEASGHALTPPSWD